jgi:hypothetical protein
MVDLFTRFTSIERESFDLYERNKESEPIIVPETIEPFLFTSVSCEYNFDVNNKIVKK